MMHFTKTFVTRDELMFMFSLERAFTERWSTPAAHEEYDSEMTTIPPLPRLEGLGKGTRYHLPTVEKWLMDHFQKGGARVEKR